MVSRVVAETKGIVVVDYTSLLLRKDQENGQSEGCGSDTKTGIHPADTKLSSLKESVFGD